MSIRTQILKGAYRLSPFSLKGDAQIKNHDPTCDISCIINFFGRLDLLEGILFSLAEQAFPKMRYEIILIEDRGGTNEGRVIAERFCAMMRVNYYALSENFGIMGHSRNFGLSHASGKYILFLDDDTVILQNDFLSKLVETFDSANADGVIPMGNASYCLLQGRYGFHEPFFPTSRCMAYRRTALRDLGGFVSDMIGQEDVEFFIRYLVSGKRSVISHGLAYYHPPLLIPNFRKPMAVGNSFYRLKHRYPLLPWLMLILNCARYAPFYLVPIRKFRELGRFGLGFLAGVIISPFKKKGFRYS